MSTSSMTRFTGLRATTSAPGASSRPVAAPRSAHRLVTQAVAEADVKVNGAPKQKAWFDLELVNIDTTT